ncbi:aldo/keto reductase [Streptomyces sp. NBC_00448]|uniref:aldo/keto reductase n=1 Tax=Streptomyces sp. NBC_00448 TaxID=2903652 RepID=UPI002E1DC6B8
MRYSRVGLSGLVVSRVGLGMMSYGDTSRRAWHLDADAALPLVRAAAEAGGTFFDTADMYDQGASEEVTGTLLREVFGSRDDYVLATKVYFPMGDAPTSRGLPRKHLHAAVDASLRRRGTDHIDLYQIHRWDDATPIEETMCALDELVRAGKVRYPGASSVYAWQFAKAQYTARAHGWSGFVSMQNLYNLAYREEEREMIPLCRDLGVLPYSPLARGFLTGSRTRGGGRSTVRCRSDPLAVDRLPLSTVGAIEFLGVVVLALVGSHSGRNLAALALAVGGVAVLTDVRLAGERLGFGYAFANCVGFMLYMVLGHRIATTGPGWRT